MSDINYCPKCGNRAVYNDIGQNEEIWKCLHCNKKFKVSDV